VFKDAAAAAAAAAMQLADAQLMQQLVQQISRPTGTKGAFVSL
jgi:hypothetical protein